MTLPLPFKAVSSKSMAIALARLPLAAATVTGSGHGWTRGHKTQFMGVISGAAALFTNGDSYESGASAIRDADR